MFVVAYAVLVLILGFSPALGHHAQMILTWLGGEGNREVHLGAGGWVFARSEIAAIHSRPSVSTSVSFPRLGTATDLTKESGTFVLESAAKLKERGVPLLLVVVPAKASIYPEFIAARKFDAPLLHADQAAILGKIRAAGIGVLDLTMDMWRLKIRKQVFFQQDSHWTPDAMKPMAELIWKQVRATHPQLVTPPDQTPIVDVHLLDRSSHGDLVDRLGVSMAERLFSQEQVTLVSVAGMDPKSDAPIALVGGSSVRVFDDPIFGFATEDELASSQLLKAGIGHQLGLLFNQPLDVTSDAGSSLVAMHSLMSRPQEEISKKKLVIWLVPAEELLEPLPVVMSSGAMGVH